MTESPSGEIGILIVALIMVVLFLLREILAKTKPTWRLGFSDFLMRPVNESNQKSVAVIVLGIVFIFIILFLIFQRINAL